MPFYVVIRLPARQSVNNTTTGRAISTLLSIKMANMPVEKAAKQAESLNIRHFGIFSRYLEQQFLAICLDFCPVADHSNPKNRRHSRVLSLIVVAQDEG